MKNIFKGTDQCRLNINLPDKAMYSCWIVNLNFLKFNRLTIELHPIQILFVYMPLIELTITNTPVFCIFILF